MRKYRNYDATTQLSARARYADKYSQMQARQALNEFKRIHSTARPSPAHDTCHFRPIADILSCRFIVCAIDKVDLNNKLMLKKANTLWYYIHRGYKNDKNIKKCYIGKRNANNINRGKAI